MRVNMSPAPFILVRLGGGQWRRSWTIMLCTRAPVRIPRKTETAMERKLTTPGVALNQDVQFVVGVSQPLHNNKEQLTFANQ